MNINIDTYLSIAVMHYTKTYFFILTYLYYLLLVVHVEVENSVSDKRWQPSCRNSWMTGQGRWQVCAPFRWNGLKMKMVAGKWMKLKGQRRWVFSHGYQVDSLIRVVSAIVHSGGSMTVYQTGCLKIAEIHVSSQIYLIACWSEWLRRLHALKKEADSPIVQFNLLHWITLLTKLYILHDFFFLISPHTPWHD